MVVTQTAAQGGSSPNEQAIEKVFGRWPKASRKDFLATAFQGQLGALAVQGAFDDMGVAGDPVQKRGGHVGLVEDLGPIGKAEVGGDDHRTALMPLGQDPAKTVPPLPWRRWSGSFHTLSSMDSPTNQRNNRF